MSGKGRREEQDVVLISPAPDIGTVAWKLALEVRSLTNGRSIEFSVEGGGLMRLWKERLVLVVMGKTHVNRSYTRLQCHHMYSEIFSTRPGYVTVVLMTFAPPAVVQELSAAGLTLRNVNATNWEAENSPGWVAQDIRPLEWQVSREEAEFAPK